MSYYDDILTLYMFDAEEYIMQQMHYSHFQN